MDKLKMAHDWAMKSLLTNGFKDEVERVSYAWQYADAMQAEAEKRDKAEAEKKRKEIREMLNAPNTFVEREGQHFDDVESLCEVDWNIAPEWAVAWTMDSSETLWWSYKPVLNNGCLFVEDSVLWKCEEAPSFGFTGSHIVERPHGF